MQVLRVARSAAIVGGLAASSVFAYFAVRGIEWAHFHAAFSHSNYWWLLPAFAVLMAGITTNLAMVIPSSPAAIGVFEAATIVAFRV